jgi:ssDNA thymidine ADP-ribosyltransferase, DarT
MGVCTRILARKALIFRITHLDNVRWILNNGLHCRSSEVLDSNFVNIGNSELIDKRQRRIVDIPPGGTLSDYIPFYFTPFSPMMLNIKTGWGGITKRSNQEIVILVSSLHRLAEEGRRFIFSDRHAYLQAAQFYADLADLDQNDWAILQARNFKRDDVDKFERYQAEALVHRHMPVESLTGIVCHNATVKKGLDALVSESEMRLRIVVKPSWYF